MHTSHINQVAAKLNLKLNEIKPDQSQGQSQAISEELLQGFSDLIDQIVAQLTEQGVWPNQVNPAVAVNKIESNAEAKRVDCDLEARPATELNHDQANKPDSQVAEETKESELRDSEVEELKGQDEGREQESAKADSVDQSTEPTTTEQSQVQNSEAADSKNAGDTQVSQDNGNNTAELELLAAALGQSLPQGTEEVLAAAEEVATDLIAAGTEGGAEDLPGKLPLTLEQLKVVAEAGIKNEEPESKLSVKAEVALPATDLESVPVEEGDPAAAKAVVLPEGFDSDPVLQDFLTALKSKLESQKLTSALEAQLKITVNPALEQLKLKIVEETIQTTLLIKELHPPGLSKSGDAKALGLNPQPQSNTSPERVGGQANVDPHSNASRSETSLRAREVPRMIMIKNMERVENVLKEVAKAHDGKTISIRLDPPSMGQVKIDVSLRDGNLHARLVAEMPQVGTFLRERSYELQQALRKMGLNFDQVTVGVSWEEKPRNEQNPQKDQSQRGFNRVVEAMADEPVEVAGIEVANSNNEMESDHWVA